MRILKLTPETQNDILQNLLKRSPNNYGEFEGRVNAIIEEVRKNRDQAIFSYTKQFDGADINADNILVTEAEIQEAYEQVDETLLSVIRKSLVNIKKYHEKQMQNSWFTSEDGIILGQKVTALATVGVYVPGGKAVYPSSVLMNVLPAKVAGVDRIVLEKMEKYMHPRWLLQKKPVLMKFIKSAALRQSQLWHSEQRVFQR